MADPKKAKRLTRGKIRLVTKSKWELPIRGSKSYWTKVCEGIESKVTRVRNISSSSPATLCLATSSTILSSTSSVSSNDTSVDDFTKTRFATELIKTPAAKPLVKIYPPEPASKILVTEKTVESPSTVKIQSDSKKESNDCIESFNSPWKLTKLSKMTKLVNDFLSSTRTRVKPSQTKNISSPQRESSFENRQTESTSDKSIEDHSKDDMSLKSTIASLTKQMSEEKITGQSEVAQTEKRSVIFREEVEEVEKFDVNDDIVEAKPKRQRAPSLSIASAVPSFGRVVISIESISSIEDEDETGKRSNGSERILNLTSKKNSEAAEIRRKVDCQKVTRDFLKVPEMKTIASSSYPGFDQSVLPSRSSSNKIETEEAFKSKLLMESQVLKKRDGIWPRRSIIHVFRALKAMKHNERSKARLQSETNRFFAAPLQIYSPTARTSLSSDDPMDLTESLSERNYEYDHFGSADDLDQDSESYRSVRARLMRNAGQHLGKDFQRAMDVKNNSLDATATDTSSSYGSLNSTGYEPKVKHRNKKERFKSAEFSIDVPRMTGIFPRIKGDKCLACMCQSLANFNRALKQRNARLSIENNVTGFLDSPSDAMGVHFSSKASFDQSSRLPISVDDSIQKDAEENHTEQYLSSSSITKNEGSRVAEIPLIPASGSCVSSLGKSVSQVDIQSRPIAKAIPKALCNAKSLISSTSIVTERSKSISDQDDSDQGCNEPVGNEGLSTGATSKYLAPFHLPINLKPSLEPLKALRHKKSRSIRSRVASAEKSGGSPSDDDDDSDDDDVRELQKQIAKIDLERNDTLMQVEENKSAIVSDESQKLDESESINESEVSQDAMESESLANGFYQAPILSDPEVIRIANRCLNENKTVNETLKVLAEEYSERLSSVFSKDTHSPRLVNVRKNEKKAKNLLTLLVDSKSYLNREKWPNDVTHLSFSSKQPPLCNSRQLKRILPLKSYNLVAPILGMAKWYPKRKSTINITSSRINPRQKESSEKSYDLIVHPPSRMAQKVLFQPDWDDTRLKPSPYALFLSKPRRKAVTWRPLTEKDLEGYDPEATLKMRAAKITDRICEDFCQWLDSSAAGTNQTSGIDVNVLKDMFETDFTAEVCKTMQMSINEMAMIPDAIAVARNCPGAGKLALTKRHLIKDARAELKPKKTIAFGTNLPSHLKILPPNNDVEKKWLHCKNVPTDLETMDAVWKDITHLNSVKGFIDWLKAHPQVSRPKALEKALASEETIATRRSHEIDGLKDLELDLDQIQSLKVGDNDPDVR